MNQKEIVEELYERALRVYDSQVKKLRDEERVREFQKVLILRVVDNKWTDHIDALDQLRNAVSLRGYAQNNPIVEYQSEAFTMFNDMIGAIEFEVTRLMMKAQIHDNIERERTSQEAHTTAVKNIMRTNRMQFRRMYLLKVLIVTIHAHASLVRNLKIVTAVIGMTRGLDGCPVLLQFLDKSLESVRLF